LPGPNGVLLFPPMPEPGIKHGNTLLKFTDVFYMSVFNLLGVPVTQCPLGLSSKGLPLGVQIVTTPYNDHLTIAVAAALEKGLGGWVSPGKIEC
jgi:fatty-acid amide hydrolase 2